MIKQSTLIHLKIIKREQFPSLIRNVDMLCCNLRAAMFGIVFREALVGVHLFVAPVNIPQTFGVKY